jgi:hypothetical protein
MIRHIGGGLVSEAGPHTLRDARRLVGELRACLEAWETAIAEAEQWRRAAGWTAPEAADVGGDGSL